MPSNIPVYQMKVLLRYIKPPIWRRLLVRSDSTLAELHEVIQVAMGWENYHLHQFIVGDTCYGEPSLLDELDMKDESRVRLDEIITGEGFNLGYEYDFGDSWEHAILVEKVRPFDLDQAYPVCLKGARACPPEDVGGVWGYEAFRAAIQDPAHPEHEMYLEWVGEEFDPEAFDVDEVNDALQGL